MTVETSFNYPSDLNASYPAAGDDKREGDDHIRGLKSVWKTTFPNVSGAVTVTHTQLNTIPDLAPKASPALTGVPTAPTASVGDATTQIATTAFVAATSLVSALPGQSGNAGKTISTDGTNASWSNLLNATVLRFKDGTDATKLLAFDLSGITTGNTRTVTLPDKSGTLAMTSDGASQAQMEAASATTVFATPGNVNWHPGVAKAWVKCDAAGAVEASHNVTSVTDDGAGLVTVTIATDFSSANYVVVPGVIRAAAGGGRSWPAVLTQAAGAFQLENWSEATGAVADPTSWYAACFGDQA
jgi:hypothetical protein